LEGELADSTTREEFEDVMKELVKTARKELAKKGITDVKFQYDNNRIQAQANIARMGMAAHEKLHLPTYSPDMNMTIEHVFAQLKKAIMAKLDKLRGKTLTPYAAQSIAISCFGNLDKAAIQRDIESLPLTWRVISTDEGKPVVTSTRKVYAGTGGGYPVSALR
jgi:hypothetical protein